MGCLKRRCSCQRSNIQLIRDILAQLRVQEHSPRPSCWVWLSYSLCCLPFLSGYLLQTTEFDVAACAHSIAPHISLISPISSCNRRRKRFGATKKAGCDIFCLQHATHHNHKTSLCVVCSVPAVLHYLLHMRHLRTACNLVPCLVVCVLVVLWVNPITRSCSPWT
jgi:hypothetical protein